MLKNTLVISLVAIQWIAVSEVHCISLSSVPSAIPNAQPLTAPRTAENSHHLRRNSYSPLLTKLREEISKRQNRTDPQYEQDLKRAIRSNPKYRLKPANLDSSSSSSQDSSSSSSSSSEECRNVDVKKVNESLKKIAHIVHCESCSSDTSEESSSSCSCSCEICKQPKAIFVPVYDVQRPKVCAPQNNYNTMRNTQPPLVNQNMYYHQPSYQQQRFQLQSKPVGYINQQY